MLKRSTMEAITILAAMDPSTHHLEETFGSSLPQSVTPNGLNAIALKRATEPAVANFFRDSIFCWFRISNASSQTIVRISSIPMYENFMSSMGSTMLSRAYPQGSGQAEATSKTLLRILSRMVYEEPSDERTLSR